MIELLLFMAEIWFNSLPYLLVGFLIWFVWWFICCTMDAKCKD